jgi:hypothetical protein
MGQKDESITFAGRVTFRSEEGVHQLCCIRYEMLELAIYRVKSEDGVLPDIRVSMLETCAAGGY